MKAYELMKLAADNPGNYVGKQYKVVCGTVVWTQLGNAITEHFNRVYVSETGNIVGIRDDGTIAGCCVSISNYTELEEIPQQVPLLEAIKAFHEGKQIICHCNGYVSEYIPNESEIQPIYGRSIKTLANYSIATLEILNGKWYIKS